MLYNFKQTNNTRATRERGVVCQSLDAWLGYTAPKPDGKPFADLSRSPCRGESWDYGTEFDDAVELVRNGWADGAKLVLKAAGGLTVLQDQADRVAIDYAPSGFMPDCQAALNGDLDCYLHAEMQPQPQQPVLTILAGFGAAGNLTAAKFTDRGAAILTVVNLLEAAGVRVELYGFDCTDSPTGTLSQLVRVKEADQALNLEALAVIFAHPIAERRLGFAVMEHIADGDHFDGYGRDAVPSKRLIATAFPNGDVYQLPAFGVNRRISDVRDMALQSLDALAEQGAFSQEQANDLKAAL